jgi:hypothetical protein
MLHSTLFFLFFVIHGTHFLNSWLQAFNTHLHFSFQLQADTCQKSFFLKKPSIFLPTSLKILTHIYTTY